MIIAEQCIAKGVCAWPNMQKLSNGELVIVFHNQPSHAQQEGELDIIFSRNSGNSWERRSALFDRVPGVCRCNQAVGVFDKRLLVFCGGWQFSPDQPYGKYLLPPVGAVSEDGGRSWEFIARPKGLFPTTCVTFGPIVAAENGDYCMVSYIPFAGLEMNLFMRSTDYGCSWKAVSIIATPGNETWLLPLKGGRWLAMVRTEEHGLLQYNSEDDGKSWHFAGNLTRQLQVSGSLLRLADGRILLSYGNRIPGEFGIETRISEDEGKTWAKPYRLANMPSHDGGYPATVELAPGQLLTAYYAEVDAPHKYEMRSIHWRF